MIRVGDMVAVVRSKPCGCVDTIGVVFTVSSVDFGPTWCGRCRAFTGIHVRARNAAPNWAFPLFRLQKINPTKQADRELATERAA